MELEERTCISPECKAKPFKVLAGSTQYWCSLSCKNKMGGEHWKQQLSGTRVHLERQKELNVKKLQTPKEDLQKKTKLTKDVDCTIKKKCSQTLATRNIDDSSLKKPTIKIKPKLIKKDGKETDLTKRLFMPNKEKDTIDLKKQNEEKSMPIVEKECLPADSLNYLGHIQRDQSESVNCLNSSVEQLMKLAKSSQDPKIALMALAEVRNTLNTKLDFIKCGLDVVKLKSNKK